MKAVKPDLLKLLIFIILIVATSVPKNLIEQGADIGANHGVPLPFYSYGGGPPMMPGQVATANFSIEFLFIDMIIWYVVACLVAFIIGRAKK